MKLRHQPSGIAFPVFSDFVRQTCRPGQGAACCRYLVGDLDGSRVHCGKLEPVLQEQIDRPARRRVMIAQADNCPGRPREESL